MKTLPEIRQQLIAVQKLCRRSIHDIAPVDKKTTGPLIALKRTLAEYLAAHVDKKKHAKAISGLRNNGGYCDCKVRCNLTDQ